jgi:magnesium-transporting ATPase (P-type)
MGFKIIAIALIIISLFSPWWVLTGEEGSFETATKTLLIPQKLVTVTSSADAIGGEISQVPEEVTMVIGLLTILLIISSLLIFISVFTKNRFSKTTVVISALSIILLIVTISLFYYVMSQLTEVGVGSFIGNGNIETTIPGVAESKVLPCSWGPNIGFYLGIITIVTLMIYPTYHKIRK